MQVSHAYLVCKPILLPEKHLLNFLIGNILIHSIPELIFYYRSR